MQDLWKEIAAELGKLFEPHGFRRARLNFINQENQEVVRTIAMVKFRWNTPGERRFQLELSIYLSTGAAGEFSFPKREGKYSLVFRKSAGYLWGDELFQYLVPDNLGEDFYARLRSDAERHILPFFERCGTIDGVVRTLEEKERRAGKNIFSALLAIALARLGRMDESRQCFLRTPGDPETVRRMAAQYGVNL